MGQGGVPGAVPDLTRDLNYSMPAVRDFYSHQNDLFLADGVQFFWNDEGEDDYFTFTEWSQSELAGLRASATPTRRYFSISAFSRRAYATHRPFPHEFLALPAAPHPPTQTARSHPAPLLSVWPSGLETCRPRGATSKTPLDTSCSGPSQGRHT